MEENILVIFENISAGESFDLEIPADITANELVTALNQGLNLGIDTSDIKQCYLKSTEPIALLKGNKTLREYGLHHGTKLWFDR